ncbi:50S ribosomal protein L1 [Mycoplasma suis]|uniref:Ribosomal protein n=2 Tax=Mycoplasma suis TaxID=57372 RepID=F0QQR8_MYCSL|nr:50S ribosomal protein L1 [Mycoplasma suis]ADX97838.1 50S ribosomal protein L1 [Mycoplasma suis str. Illinois]CBZ40337.1 Ribosomal protein L1 [Mycoplasma suis KI3806]
MELKDILNEIKNNKKDTFTESIDVVFHLSIHSKKNDQNIKLNYLLPHPVIKRPLKLLVFDDKLGEADRQKHNIDYLGNEEIIDKIRAGWLDFDLIISAQSCMPKLLVLGKILGPKGLLPSVKEGTVVQDTIATVEKFRAGQKVLRNDSGGNVHLSIGLVTFENEKLIENFEYLLKLIKSKKPASIKKNYIKKISFSSTMGKSFKLDTKGLV